MTRHPLTRDWHATAILLGAFVILIGLADVAAHKARHAMRKRDQTILLFPGFTADELPGPGHRLVVTSLQSASEAQMDGIAVGDEVLTIDNHSVSSLKDAEQVMNRENQAVLALRLLHNATPFNVTLHDNGARRHGA